MATTIQTLDTCYYADAVEWCPHDNHQDILLCGTYQLDTSKKKTETVDENEDSQDSQEEQCSASKNQTRIGRLNVYQLTHSKNVSEKQEEGCSAGETQQSWANGQGKCLHLVTSLDMPGILDIKWCPHPTENISTFAVVNSVGQLCLYQLESDSGKIAVKEVWTSYLGKACLGLSLDWSNKVNHRSDPHIITSTSDGCVQIHTLEGEDVSFVTQWKAHDYEPWICAFNFWDNNIVYTGGDDCRLKVWDTRMDPKSPTVVCKRHSMGVTSIQSNPLKENMLCTGSYDEQLLLWDSRNMRRPLSDVSIGGGIWRVKWEPSRGEHVLSATMYNGYHVVKMDSGNNLEVLHHYDKDGALCYGADWLYGEETLALNKQTLQRSQTADINNHSEHLSSSSSLDSNTCYLGDVNNVLKTIATCSFYDHSLQLWQINLKLPCSTG